MRKWQRMGSRGTTEREWHRMGGRGVREKKWQRMGSSRGNGRIGAAEEGR